MLSVKLKYLDRDNDRRKQVAKMYFDGVDSSKYVLPLNDSIDNVFHVFPIRVNNRDEIKSMLENYGIHTMIHYPIPPHKQKAYKEKLGEKYLISEKIHQEIISLPISPYICDDDILYIIDTLNNLK